MESRVVCTIILKFPNSSEITVVSNLNEAYSSDGVPTLASKVELPSEVSLVYSIVPQSPRSKNS